MKALNIYRSKSGYTKAYAEWIADALKKDIKVNRKLRFYDAEPYDTVICSGMSARSVDGISFIRSHTENQL